MTVNEPKAAVAGEWTALAGPVEEEAVEDGQQGERESAVQRGGQPCAGVAAVFVAAVDGRAPRV